MPKPREIAVSRAKIPEIEPIFISNFLYMTEIWFIIRR